MSGFEIFEALESVETPGVSELQEQREQLRLQVEAAQEAGNTEKANYFLGEMSKLDAQLTQLESQGETGEIAFGKGYSAGHSEDYWRKEAAKELAERGKTPHYYTCKKRLEEAIENDAKEKTR